MSEEITVEDDLLRKLLNYTSKLVQLQMNSKRPYLESFLYFAIFHWPAKSSLKYQNLATFRTYKHFTDQWENFFAKNNFISTGEQRKFYKGKNYFVLSKNRVKVIDVNEIKEEWCRQKEEEEGRTRMPVYRDFFWREEFVANQVERLIGLLDNDGKVILHKVLYTTGEKDFPIKSFYPCPQLQNRQVSFILGFTWSGLRAFDVIECGISSGSEAYCMVTNSNHKGTANVQMRQSPTSDEIGNWKQPDGGQERHSRVAGERRRGKSRWKRSAALSSGSGKTRGRNVSCAEVEENFSQTAQDATLSHVYSRESLESQSKETYNTPRREANAYCRGQSIHSERKTQTPAELFPHTSFEPRRIKDADRSYAENLPITQLGSTQTRGWEVSNKDEGLQTAQDATLSHTYSSRHTGSKCKEIGRTPQNESCTFCRGGKIPTEEQTLSLDDFPPLERFTSPDPYKKKQTKMTCLEEFPKPESELEDRMPQKKKQPSVPKLKKRMRQSDQNQRFRDLDEIN